MMTRPMPCWQSSGHTDIASAFRTPVGRKEALVWLALPRRMWQRPWRSAYDGVQ